MLGMMQVLETIALQVISAVVEGRTARNDLPPPKVIPVQISTGPGHWQFVQWRCHGGIVEDIMLLKAHAKPEIQKWTEADGLDVFADAEGVAAKLGRRRVPVLPALWPAVSRSVHHPVRRVVIESYRLIVRPLRARWGISLKLHRGGPRCCPPVLGPTFLHTRCPHPSLDVFRSRSEASVPSRTSFASCLNCPCLYSLACLHVAHTACPYSFPGPVTCIGLFEIWPTCPQRLSSNPCKILSMDTFCAHGYLSHQIVHWASLIFQPDILPATNGSSRGSLVCLDGVPIH